MTDIQTEAAPEVQKDPLEQMMGMYHDLAVATQDVRDTEIQLGISAGSWGNWAKNNADRELTEDDYARYGRGRFHEETLRQELVDKQHRKHDISRALFDIVRNELIFRPVKISSANAESSIKALTPTRTGLANKDMRSEVVGELWFPSMDDSLTINVNPTRVRDRLRGITRFSAAVYQEDRYLPGILPIRFDTPLVTVELID